MEVFGRLDTLRVDISRRSAMNALQRILIVCAPVLFLALHPSASAQDVMTFRGLGITGSNAYASDLNADGSVLVGRYGNGPHRAFRWSETDGLVDFGLLPGRYRSAGQRVSPDGSVVVGYSSAHVEVGFR
jgi:hypothetical protein